MISAAFRAAERARRRHKPVSPAQRGTIALLCRTTGIEQLEVHDGNKASRAITRLLVIRDKPTLFVQPPGAEA